MLNLNHFVLFLSLLIFLIGKIRVSKWFSTYTQKEMSKISKEATNLVLNRREKQSNFLDFGELTLVYRRYASLFVLAAIDRTDNELITLEIIHTLVTILDRFFENVCELDIIYNFEKVRFCVLLLSKRSTEKAFVCVCCVCVRACVRMCVVVIVSEQTCNFK